jgi:hypothetical protein
LQLPWHDAWHLPEQVALALPWQLASHSPWQVAVHDALQSAAHSAWFASLWQWAVHVESHVAPQVPLQFAEQSKFAFALQLPSHVPLHVTSHDGGVTLHCPWHCAYSAALHEIGVHCASHERPVSTEHWAVASTLMFPQSAMLAARAEPIHARDERTAAKPMKYRRAIVTLLVQKAEANAHAPGAHWRQGLILPRNGPDDQRA